MGHTAGLHKIDFLLHIKNSKKKKTYMESQRGHGIVKI